MGAGQRAAPRTAQSLARLSNTRRKRMPTGLPAAPPALKGAPGGTCGKGPGCPRARGATPSAGTKTLEPLCQLVPPPPKHPWRPPGPPGIRPPRGMGVLALCKPGSRASKTRAGGGGFGSALRRELAAVSFFACSQPPLSDAPNWRHPYLAPYVQYGLRAGYVRSQIRVGSDTGQFEYPTTPWSYSNSSLVYSGYTLRIAEDDTGRQGRDSER
mmetsp:Transcript_63928/g.144217  ORF Transcript_63928/g.144217 Transcript_63928/m.144217 type:complete len:213 (-) Transcript_63928:235-873(-)